MTAGVPCDIGVARSFDRDSHRVRNDGIPVAVFCFVGWSRSHWRARRNSAGTSRPLNDSTYSANLAAGRAQFRRLPLIGNTMPDGSDASACGGSEQEEALASSNTLLFSSVGALFVTLGASRSALFLRLSFALRFAVSDRCLPVSRLCLSKFGNLRPESITSSQPESISA